MRLPIRELDSAITQAVKTHPYALLIAGLPESATSISVRSSAVNRRARQALMAFADNSRHGSDWAAAIYSDARGKRHPHAVRSLVGVWLIQGSHCPCRTFNLDADLDNG